MNTMNRTIAILAGCLSGITLSPGSVEAADNWYKNQLLHPSGHQLKAEQRGRVAIYDGLHESTVDAALDTQFERIENMMFVRVAHTMPDGDDWADDDCD